MRRGVPNLLKNGAQHLTGLDEAVLRNLEACKMLSELLRTSLGPQGMNKMIINHLSKLFVTSDTATILKEVEVEQAAAKILVMAAQMQEQEMGDGSNYVCMIGGELLNLAQDLIYQGLHPQDIISGYTMAAQKVTEVSKNFVVHGIDTDELVNVDKLAQVIKTPISTKQYGFENELSKLVAEACVAVMPKNTFNFAVDNVRVMKVLGGSIHQSYVVRGMVFPQVPISQSPSLCDIADAKIAIFTCPIDAADTDTKGSALLSNAQELMDFNQDEEKQIEKYILDIKSSGVNVVVTGGTVSDLAAHYLEKHSIMCIRLQSRFELRRLCRATGARPLVSLGAIPPEYQGHCSRVYIKEIGLDHFTIFEHNEGNECNISTIVLRAATHNTLNDVERAIDDGVNTVRAMGKERRGIFLPGAGAYEAAVAHSLQSFARNDVSGIQQYAIEKFAEAFLIVPRTLAENAGYDAVNVVANLLEIHQKDNNTESLPIGLDIEASGNRVQKPFLNVNDKQIYDLYNVKMNALRLIMDAVCTILRIDQIVTCKKAGGPQIGAHKKLASQQGAEGWDDNDENF
jgi:T-complex protein 1 subunit theta